MFRKLFGETNEEQIAYLKKKSVITAVCLVLDIFVLIFAKGILFTPICCYVWAWGFMRAYFGFTTFGSIFSGNPVVAALIIGAYLLLGFLIGSITMFLGVGRFIYLSVKFSKGT